MLLTVFVGGQKNIKISLSALFLSLFWGFFSPSSLIIHAAHVHVIPGLRQSCEEMCRLIISYQILTDQFSQRNPFWPLS